MNLKTFAQVALYLVLAAILVGCGSDGPEISVDRLSHEFPSGPDGNVQTHFTITNRGNKVLEQRDIVASCECSTPALSKTRLGPNEFTTLPVRITRPSIGINPVVVTIISNDVRTPRLELKLRTWASDNNPRITEIQPRRIAIRVPCDESELPEITVVSLEKTSERFVTDVTSTLPFVQCANVEVTETPSYTPEYTMRKYRFKLVLDGSELDQASAGAFVIKTHSGTSEGQTIPLSVRHAQKVDVRPATLFAIVEPDGKTLPSWTLNVDAPEALVDVAAAAPIVLSTTADWLEAQVETPRSAAEGQPRDSKIVVSVKKIPTSFPASAEVRMNVSGNDVAVPVTLSQL